MSLYTLTVNTIKHKILTDPDTPLLWVLRDMLGLTGTKYGCGTGVCGACTVHFNGKAIRSCMRTLATASEGDILTIEGVSANPDHPLHLAWSALDVAQCGYCQPGQIMSAYSLLSKNSRPTDKEIHSAMQGNICRCGSYDRIRRAIHRAANKMEK